MRAVVTKPKRVGDSLLRDAHGRKECTICRRWQDEECFAALKHTSDGLNYQCRECRQEYLWMRNYGITREDYNRMLAEQVGKCAICGGDPEGGRASRLPVAAFHVDHDHETGKVRGLLCAHCNTGLGKFKDDPARMRAAAGYLERHSA